jgi:hypothetical protein
MVASGKAMNEIAAGTFAGVVVRPCLARLGLALASALARHSPARVFGGAAAAPFSGRLSPLLRL